MEIRLKKHIGAFKKGKINSKIVQYFLEIDHILLFANTCIFKASCISYDGRLFLESVDLLRYNCRH